MPPTAEDRLRDILEAIAEINTMLAGFSREQFAADKMRRMATERYLEVVCEAARKLSEKIKRDERDIDWRKMNDFGNRLRHACHGTDVDIVWDIIQNHLPRLNSFVKRHIQAAGKWRVHAAQRWRQRSAMTNSKVLAKDLGAVSLAAITFACRLCLAGALACVATTVAAEPKPDAAIKTKEVEVSVFLDDKIKADPALAADCLAEGKAWVKKNRADADKQQDPILFRDGAWSFERRYAIRSVVGGQYVSIVRSDYMDMHGAHPNSDVNTILWDTTQKKRISIRPFFTETADNGPTMTAMHKAVIASLNIEKKKRDSSETATADWYRAVEPKLLKIGAVTLAPSTEAGKSSGLTFHYPPYAVGPYAEGDYIAFVPWEALKPYLTPEGIRIFGGARPKGDDDGTR